MADCLKRSIWSNQYLRKKNNNAIYKAVIRCILTCVAKARPESKNKRQVMEGSEISVLRRITNKTFRDRESNITNMGLIDTISDCILQFQCRK